MRSYAASRWRARQHLRVVDPLEIEVLGQDDGRGDERSRERPAPGLVDAGDQAEALLAAARARSARGRALVDPPDPRRRPDDHEGPTDHLVDGTNPRPNRESFEFSRLSPRTKSESCRNGHRAVVPRVDRPLQVGLGDLAPVDEQPPVPQLDRLAGQADHALDEVLVLRAARCRASPRASARSRRRPRGRARDGPAGPRTR